jgi:hypothetical protein
VLARLSVLSAFLVLLLVAAGCGGGGSSSVETSSGHPPESAETVKAAFIAQADALCTDDHAKSAPIRAEIEKIEASGNPESPPNEARLGELLKQAIGAAEVEVEAIRELETPPADQATIGKMLDAAGEGSGLGRKTATALEEGDEARFVELAQEDEAINNRVRGIAEGYGFKVCGQEP